MGGGINTNTISSIRSGGIGGGSPGGGGLFGASLSSLNKDDAKKGLDQIFGKVGLGDSFLNRNQGINRPVLGAPISTDGGDEKKKTTIDQIFGQVGMGDAFLNRNQGINRPILGAAVAQADIDDKKKKLLGNLNLGTASRALMGAPIKMSPEEHRKLKDYIAEIVGGSAVSNIQVQAPIVSSGGGGQIGAQAVQVAAPSQGPQGQLGQVPLPQGQGQPQGQVQAPQGQQGQAQKVQDVYNQALQKLQQLQQEEQLIRQRVNLLGSIVENFTPFNLDTTMYTLLSISIIIVFVVYMTKMKF